MRSFLARSRRDNDCSGNTSAEHAFRGQQVTIGDVTLRVIAPSGRVNG
jgi:hypothetical protein